ncbi:MAG TPA: glutathione transferase GstA [Alphaproteobacteria bacterium]|nr:glutathione transferase GstA [Alphaproteobacteria bacterium]
MKLYYSPGACSLSPHIALLEAGLKADIIKVDLKEKKTETGADYWAVNAKGSVPALEMADGGILTEGPAIVQYIADQAPQSGIAPANGTVGRYRVQEALNFITSELHKGFGPLFNKATPEDYKPMARENLEKKFAVVEKMLEGKQYLMGDSYSVPDGYLFTVCRWAKAFKFAFGPNLQAHFERMMARPAVQAALKAEGLTGEGK